MLPLSQILSTKKDTKPGDQRRHCNTEFIKQVLPKFTKPTTDFGFKESTTFLGIINESFDEVDRFEDETLDEGREDRLERGPFNIVVSESCLLDSGTRSRSFDEFLECDSIGFLENKVIASFSFVDLRLLAFLMGARVRLCLFSIETVEFDETEYRFEDTDDDEIE